MKQSLYIETTIPSYLAARTSNNLIVAGRQALTHAFWEDERHKYDLFISDFVVEECKKGDPPTALKRIALLDGIDTLHVNPDIVQLADVYVRLLSIPQRSKIDAFHLNFRTPKSEVFYR